MSGAIVGLLLVALAIGVIVWFSRSDRYSLPTGYGGDLRQFRQNGRKWALLAGVLIVASIPVGVSWFGYKGTHLPNKLLPGVPFTDKWLLVGCLAGVYAIAAIGLNLLIGNTGQISLGHSAFIATGSFALGFFGHQLTSGEERGLLNIGVKLDGVFVLILAAIVGGLVSAAIGPFALRLRGNYLAIVSLVLVLFAQHLIKNWEGMTGGEGNPRTLPSLTFLDIFPNNDGIILRSAEGETNLFDSIFFTNASGSPTDKPGFFWTIWIVVVIAAVLARNLLRSRQGRAMMAVRDRDLSAEVIGVRQMYTKTWAFAISGAFGAVAGALYGSLFDHVNESTFNLAFSIAFVTMIVIGGVGTVSGSIVGALFYAFVPEILLYFQPWLVKNIGFIQDDPAKPGLTIDRFTTMLFGFLLILFLIRFPEGLVGIWRKVKRYAVTWPLG
jgi:branched-chain amino acid transport system permease protein